MSRDIWPPKHVIWPTRSIWPLSCVKRFKMAECFKTMFQGQMKLLDLGLINQAQEVNLHCIHLILILVLGSKSLILDPWSWILDLGSLILDPWSWILDLESLILVGDDEENTQQVGALLLGQFRKTDISTFFLQSGKLQLVCRSAPFDSRTVTSLRSPSFRSTARGGSDLTYSKR